MKVVTTERLTVGIDKNGKLKKLSNTSCDASDLNSCWEDVLVDTTAVTNQIKPTLKFVKVSSNQHNIVALDEFGMKVSKHCSHHLILLMHLM